LFIDLIGATYSIIAIGAAPANWLFMIIPIVLGVLSYVFYHKRKETVQSDVTPRHSYAKVALQP